MAIMLWALADVTRRNIAGRSIPGTIEYIELGLVVLVYMAVAYVQSNDEHVSVDILTRLVPDTVGRRLHQFGLAVTVIVVGWLAYGAAGEAVRSIVEYHVRVGTIRVPMWPSRLALAFGMVTLAVQLLHDFIEALRRPQLGTTGPREEDMLEASQPPRQSR